MKGLISFGFLAGKKRLQLIILLALVLTLPLFVWAIMTQRAELRKRAASNQPPVGNSANWSTNFATLTAQNFYIKANNQFFFGNGSSVVSNVAVQSDAGAIYPTLEVTWNEIDVPQGGVSQTIEMRIFMYFETDGRNWWAREIRTYDGKRTNPDWIYYHGRFFESAIGAPFTGTLTLNSDVAGLGQIHFSNLKLVAYQNTTASGPCWGRVINYNGTLYWPDGCRGRQTGDMCTQALVPLTPEEITQYNAWISAGKPPIPGCPPPKPIPSVSPTPPPNCRYQQVQCIQAPCHPVLICNTPGPCTPLPRCVYEPQVGTNGAPIYCDPQPLAAGMPAYCPRPTPPSMTSCVGRPNGSTCQTNTCPVCLPGQPCPMIACRPVFGICQNQKCVTVTPTPAVSTPTPTTPTTTVAPGPQTYDIRLKFMGVDGDGANGAKVTVRFITTSSDRITPPVAVTHIGNGVYKALFTLSQGLGAGERFTIIVKGEKHIAAKFCNQTGQISPCAAGASMTVPNPSPLTYGFDFTGLPLPPGDTNPQDGRADSADYARIKDLLGKACSQLSEADKLTGDLDYNGCVNISDAFLMRRTLETRYDEN